MSIGETEITILGGGPAGLSAAWFAHKAGREFRLFEAGDRFGGNAITFQTGDFRYDSGAHRFHDQDAAITEEVKTLMGATLQKIGAPSQILYEGKFIDFPLTPLNLLRSLGFFRSLGAGADLLWARLFRSKGRGSFADQVLKTYGKGIAQPFLLDYSKKLWGREPEDLSPAISGKRLKGLNLKTFVLEALFGKAAKTTHIDGEFYYPQEGIGQLFEMMAADMGPASLETHSRITRLHHDGNTLQTLELNGNRTWPAGWVVSSLPLSLHFHLLDPPPPAELVALAKSMEFRQLLLVAIFIDRPQVTPNASLYFPEPQFDFTRVVESKNRSAQLAPPHQTVLVAEIPCAATDAIWEMDEAALIQKTGAQLAGTGLITPEEILGGAVHRIRNAYPILEWGFEDKVAPLVTYLSRFRNLRLAGRNAEFAYTHIHDLMRRGKDLLDGIG